MTRKTVVRGPLLSSVVMVAMASAATGLLAVIGFQALPESVVPTTFGSGEEHETRNVDVSESPTSVLSTRKPTPPPSVTPSATRTGGGSVQYPVRSGTTRTTATTTTAPKPAATTTPPKVSPKPSATASKPPSTSPSPSCSHPKGKCHKSTTSTSYDSGADRTYSSAETPTYSSTKAKHVKPKSHGKKKK